MNQEEMETDPGIMPSNHNIKSFLCFHHARLAYGDFFLNAELQRQRLNVHHYWENNNG